MQIILLKDVPKVGKRAEVVTVSEGYALNCLIPKGLARAATHSALRELEAQKTRMASEQAASDAELKALVTASNGKTLTLHVRANEQGHLFAALHASDIASALYDQLGISIPETAVVLAEPFKAVGKHDIGIEGGGAKAKLHLVIEPLPEK